MPGLGMKPALCHRHGFRRERAFHRLRGLVLIAWLSVGTVPAAEISQPPAADLRDPGARPKVGLVLSGGGARGAAHVGVLKVLHEFRIPIDYVVGTSMGSVVGGLYASGMSPEEIEQALLAQDWEGIFQDLPNRPLRPFRRKRDDRIYLVKFKPGFNEGQFELPIAAIQGQKFDLALNQLTLGVAEVSNSTNCRSRIAPWPRTSLPANPWSSNAAAWRRQCARAWRFPALLRRWRSKAGCWWTVAYRIICPWISRGRWGPTCLSW